MFTPAATNLSSSGDFQWINRQTAELWPTAVSDLVLTNAWCPFQKTEVATVVNMIMKENLYLIIIDFFKVSFWFLLSFITRFKDRLSCLFSSRTVGPTWTPGRPSYRNSGLFWKRAVRAWPKRFTLTWCRCSASCLERSPIQAWTSTTASSLPSHRGNTQHWGHNNTDRFLKVNPYSVPVFPTVCPVSALSAANQKAPR